jgi:hypothetical protein
VLLLALLLLLGTLLLLLLLDLLLLLLLLPPWGYLAGAPHHAAPARNTAAPDIINGLRCVLHCALIPFLSMHDTAQLIIVNVQETVNAIGKCQRFSQEPEHVAASCRTARS